jgi:endonuclease-3
VSPRCDLCDLSSKGLCPSARKVVSAKSRKTNIGQKNASTPKVEIGVDERYSNPEDESP